MPDVVRTVGRYGILRPVGRGGMGVVYLARQLDLDRLVALKEMSTLHADEPMLARRFVRESRLAGSIAHANVVTVFDFFEHDGTPYIAMEYLERGSLRPYVGRMDLAQIGGVLSGVLAGLDAAAQRGIVHRDLKPENLLVAVDGTVKIADFGIAKATQSSPTSALVTATGIAIGTPAYMAPEQALARDIGSWTDLYSAGCIAYELFAGTPPFHDADTPPMAIMLRHINDPLPSVHDIAGVDRDISDWIARLTAKDPHDRPPSANAALDELEEILILKVGPRWRRDSRLGEPPVPLAGTEPPATPSTDVSFGADDVPTTGPATPATEIAGIDVDGTGPDTPENLQAAPTADSVARLARAAAVGILVAVLLPIAISGDDRWNVFAAFSPFAAAAAAATTWWAARRTGAFAAGIQFVVGVLCAVASLGLAKFAVERLDGVAIALVVLAVASALALFAVGLIRLRDTRGEAPAPLDPGMLVLGLAGAAAACAALFVNYDGYSSLWVELQEGSSAEFFFAPGVALAVIVTGLAIAGSRPRLAAGILVAAGAATALQYAGVIVAAAGAIGEPGQVRPGGFIGVAGGLLVAAAGVVAARRGR